MPANGVTQERFGSLMDTFTAGCLELMDVVSGHWEAKCAELLEDHGRKLEALLIQKSKNKANLRQEIDELKERAEREAVAREEAYK